MLKQFTWQDFLIAALVLSVVWYGFVGLFFYREEVGSLFGGDGIGGLADGERTLPSRWGGSSEEMKRVGVGEVTPAGTPQVSESLMGKTKLPEGMSAMGANQVSYVGAGDAAGDDPGAAKAAQVGFVPDVIQEVKEVFAYLAKGDGSKSDFFLLMEEVKDTYPETSSHPSMGKINAFIREHAPFHISAEELENLWG